jgi:hypothetical protein
MFVSEACDDNPVGTVVSYLVILAILVFFQPRHLGRFQLPFGRRLGVVLEVRQFLAIFFGFV